MREKHLGPRGLIVLSLLLAGFGVAQASQQEEREDVREEASDAAEVLTRANEVLMQMPADEENRVPPQVLEQAAGIAIFPDVTKVAVGVGGRYGEGVLLRRQAEGWSAPAFVNLYGGSIGPQLGATASDLILVFMDEEDVLDVLETEFSLGADASVALGPWGAKAKESTAAEILVYKRTEGVFAGIDLTGAVLSEDEDMNQAFYFGVEADDEGFFEDSSHILTSEPRQPLPQQAEMLRESLEQYASKAKQPTEN